MVATRKRFSAPTQALVAGVGLLAMAACASHPKPPPTAYREAAPAGAPSSPSYPAPPPGAVSSQPLPGTVQDFVINVGDRVYFDFDQATIRADARPILAAQASWLDRYPSVHVRIEGNCDDTLPPSGPQGPTTLKRFNIDLISA